jgi:transposase
MLSRIGGLFAVDRRALDTGMSHAERLSLRAAESAGIVDGIERRLRELGSSLPASELGKAVSYTRSLWGSLTQFLKHGELEINTNFAENSMRGVVLGRKNWIHIGSEAAGPKVAAVVSVIETCRKMGVPVREYLLDVLPGMGDRLVSEADLLTPRAWLASRK